MMRIVKNICRDRKITTVEEFKRTYEKEMFPDEISDDWSKDVKIWHESFDANARIDFLKELKRIDIERNLYREYSGYGYHGGGRKPTGVKRTGMSLSGKPEQIAKLKELAKEAGMSHSEFILRKCGVITD